MKLLIITTAVNRPELHNESFKSYRRILSKDWDIKWIVNIDTVDGLEASPEATARNMMNLMVDYDNLKFLFFTSHTGWFNRAVRRVLTHAKEYVDQVDCVLYLEGDWGLRNARKAPDLKRLLRRDVGYNFADKDFIIGLSERIFLTGEYINFQPQLWSRSMFKTFIEVFDHVKDTNVSPELIVEENFRKFKDVRSATKSRYKFFKDIGRQWMLKKGMRKRHKRSRNYAGEGSVYTKPKAMEYNSYEDYVNKCKLKNTGWDVSKFTMDVNGKKLGITLPENYDTLIDNIAEAFDKKMDGGEYVLGANNIVTQILDPLSVKEVLDLGEHFSKELAEKLYGGECYINFVHPYQTNIVNKREIWSWLWHYDDVPYGLIKIMVYLRPTNRKTGSFLVLKKGEDEYALMEPSRVAPNKMRKPKWKGSRIPNKEIQRLKREGFKEEYIEGDKGTFMVFNHNILHKGTIPTEGPERMCLIYHFRPYNKKLKYHINKEMTFDWSTPAIKSKKYNYHNFN